MISLDGRGSANALRPHVPRCVVAVVFVVVLFSTTARAESAERVPLDLAGQRVAVLEVTGDVPVAQLKKLADEIRAGAFDALSPRGALVVTREATLAILREMGADCGEGECEIDTLRALSAHLGIVADVTRDAERAVLAIKVVDVESGALRAIFDVTARSLKQLLLNTRVAVGERLSKALPSSSLLAMQTADGAEARALVTRAPAPLRVAQKTPLPAAIARACQRVLEGEPACDPALLASMPHVERRASSHEQMEVDGTLNGDLDDGCFESVTISFHPRVRARLDLSRARLHAAGYEYELAPLRTKSRAIWAERGAPSVVELTGAFDAEERCLRHDFAASPIRVEIPVETDESLEQIVVEWSSTTEPIDERSAILALGRPARPSSWPDEPTYAPSFVTLTVVGLAVTSSALAGGLASSALVLDALPRKHGAAEGVPPTLIFFASYPFAALAVPLIISSGCLGLYEFFRWTSFRREDARFARLVRYEKRLAELASSTSDAASPE